MQHQGLAPETPFQRRALCFFTRTLASQTGYETRPQQLNMALAAAKAIESQRFLLVEAGTGTGKSLAYLVPAVLWATATGEPVVVSTRTINLQQQLVGKDLPALAGLLEVPFRAVLARGWSNYVCLRRLHSLPGSGEVTAELEHRASLLAERLARGASGIRQQTHVDPALWARICCDSTACGRQQCPWFDDCYLFKDRRALEGADLVVTNHSLLLADLAIRRQGGPGILPSHAGLVIDEGHHLEDVATQHLGRSFGFFEFKRLSNQLYEPGSDLERSGFFPGLRQRLAGLVVDAQVKRRLLAAVDHRMLSAVAPLNAATEEFFDGAALLFEDGKQVLDESHFETDLGLEIRKAGALVGAHLGGLVESCNSLAGELADLDLPLATEAGLELQGYAGRLGQMAADLEFCLFPDSQDWVYWGHHSRRDTGLTATPLDVGEILGDELFGKARSLIVTSATLAVKGDLGFFARRVGLDRHQHRCQELCLDSPFDYPNQVYLGVAADLPDPNDPGFVDQVVPEVSELVARLKGKTFLLVTSWTLLRRLEVELRPRLAATGVRLLAQGEDSGGRLLQTFRSPGDYLLLGTDSFWEGVDVPGEDLSCVILARLPFRVPSDPIIAAHSQRIEQDGGNPFRDYQLPLAVLKFRQGFGRLIRTGKDRGLVIVLDGRLRSKPYGKDFLSSIPCCRRRCGPLGGLISEGLDWLEGPPSGGTDD